MKTFALAFGETFGVLFPIVDPLGNVPTFLAITGGHTQAERWRVITRVVPSTVDDTMPGNHSWIRDGSPIRAHTSSGERAMRTCRRTLARGGVMPVSRR